jgi:YHS domain-containing protein
MLTMTKTHWAALPAAAAFAIVALGAGVLLAADEKQSPTTAPTTQQTAAVNKYCAVMGDEHKIDPKVTVQHKGQTIGFCCADCITEFKKDPDKYVAKMK